MGYELVESEARLLGAAVSELEERRYREVCGRLAFSEIEEALVNHAERYDCLPTPEQMLAWVQPEDEDESDGDDELHAAPT